MEPRGFKRRPGVEKQVELLGWEFFLGWWMEGVFFRDLMVEGCRMYYIFVICLLTCAFNSWRSIFLFSMLKFFCSWLVISCAVVVFWVCFDVLHAKRCCCFVVSEWFGSESMEGAPSKTYTPTNIPTTASSRQPQGQPVMPQKLLKAEDNLTFWQAHCIEGASGQLPFVTSGP